MKKGTHVMAVLCLCVGKTSKANPTNTTVNSVFGEPHMLIFHPLRNEPGRLHLQEDNANWPDVYRCPHTREKLVGLWHFSSFTPINFMHPVGG